MFPGLPTLLFPVAPAKVGAQLAMPPCTLGAMDPGLRRGDGRVLTAGAEL